MENIGQFDPGRRFTPPFEKPPRFSCDVRSFVRDVRCRRCSDASRRPSGTSRRSPPTWARCRSASRPRARAPSPPYRSVRLDASSVILLSASQVPRGSGELPSGWLCYPLVSRPARCPQAIYLTPLIVLSLPDALVTLSVLPLWLSCLSRPLSSPCLAYPPPVALSSLIPLL